MVLASPASHTLAWKLGSCLVQLDASLAWPGLVGVAYGTGCTIPWKTGLISSLVCRTMSLAINREAVKLEAGKACE